MRTWIRRAARLAAAVFVGILLGTLFATDQALRAGERVSPRIDIATATSRQTGSTYESVQVVAQDEIRLDGWIFVPPQPNGAVVILLHGLGDTRIGMVGQASFLLRAHYTVLLPDSRGHGSSGGDLVTYGIRERNDIRCWTDWLVRTHHVERLYGLGQSMGAGILIQALSREPRFRAIVADSSFSSIEEMSYDRLYDTIRLPRWAAWPLVRFGFFYAHVRYGIDLRQASPVEGVRNTTVPILIIHGMADAIVPFHHSQNLRSANLNATRLWPVPRADHVESFYADPDGYSRAVLEWFGSH